MRADLRRKQSALGIKVQALITDVNRLQNDYQLTNEDFESGNFPWLDMASSKKNFNDFIFFHHKSLNIKITFLSRGLLERV